MSSLFTTSRKANIKTTFGKGKLIPFYLQFVPGLCTNVVHSFESKGYSGEQSINSIHAIPHITEKPFKRKSLTQVSEENRYFPLLRNHGDIPTKGDPVLLVTIGRINYYLGPLNTMENSPTFNEDPSLKNEIIFSETNVEKRSAREIKGQSLNFNKEFKYQRLQKRKTDGLDYGPVPGETIGDYLIEGRHGNSLRIGSRSNDPYILISNRRHNTNSFESLGDGTLLSITSKGTLSQHLQPFNETGSDGEPVFGFSLASGIKIGTNVSKVNNGQNVQELIYDYDKNQMLLHSDRITLNSKLDDIYLSSINDIHIGTGRHLIISSNKEVIIDAENIKFGNFEKSKMEGMVLGKQLQEILNDILTLIPNITTPTFFSPTTKPTPQVKTQADSIKNKVKKLLSNKHFIQKN